MQEIYLRMSYDAEADAGYIYLTDPIEDGAVARSFFMGPHESGTARGLTGSLDAEDKILGIELLGISKLVRPEVLDG